MLRDPRRPLSVTIIGWIYVVVGTFGFVYHLSESLRQPFNYGAVAIPLVSAVAIVAGIFLLRGDDWARWLALLWIAAHVGISFLDGWRPIAIHAVFMALIAFFLLRRNASEYFRPSACDGTVSA